VCSRASNEVVHTTECKTVRSEEGKAMGSELHYEQVTGVFNDFDRNFDINFVRGG
jgi:hypothetical protein